MADVVELGPLSLPEHPGFGPCTAALQLPDRGDPWLAIRLEEWREIYEIDLSELNRDEVEVVATANSVGAKTVIHLGRENLLSLRAAILAELGALPEPPQPKRPGWRLRPSELAERLA